MRNNNGRISLPQTEILSNSPQGFLSTQQTVELPTKGTFYGKNSSLFQKNFLELKDMTTAEEDILSNTSYLKNNIALEKFISSVLVDKSIKVDDLHPCDFEFLLIYSRMTGYGSGYDAVITCSKCGKDSKKTIDTRVMLETLRFPENLEKVTEDGTLMVRLDRLNADIECNVIKQGDIRWLEESRRQKNLKNQPETNKTDLLRKIIVSINGNQDKDYLEQFIAAAKPVDTRYIFSVLEEHVVTLNKKFDFVCDNKECGHAQQMEVPVSTKFFWP